jgi:uncharacterized protein DUF3306
MRSVLLSGRCQSRERSSTASFFTKVPPPRAVFGRRKRRAKFRRSQVVMLLALSVPAVLAEGAMAQVRESSPPVLSSGLGNAAFVKAPVIEELRQHPATEFLLDLANLPPIESIGSGSDIRPFLAPGVPADLTRAALRRAWSTDPAIRDFVGLSENSGDFNELEAVPVVGLLTRDGPPTAHASTAPASR